MPSVYITRKIPDIGIEMLRNKGYEVDINPNDRPVTKNELVAALSTKKYDAVLTLLTDKIDSDVFEAAPTVKIFANYAIGFDNFAVEEAKHRGIYLTNTPGGGADRVAEHAWALILALSCRVVEGDKFVRDGKYLGWDPMILHGTKLSGKTLGLIGTGRIGGEVARIGSAGFGMRVIYNDMQRNEKIESMHKATYWPKAEDVLKQADIVSLHVPLTDSTRHLIDITRLSMMKLSALLINTARGPIIKEADLIEALENHVIAGAGLDVYENEPVISEKLKALPNVVLTPHIASATVEARLDMAKMSAQNIITTLEGGRPDNLVYN